MGVTLRHAALERLGAPAGDQPGGVEQVLHTVGNAVQRAKPHASRGERIRGIRLTEREIGRHDGEAVQTRVERRDARQIDLGQPPAAEGAGADPGREVGERRKCDRLRIGRARRLDGGVAHGSLRIGQPRGRQARVEVAGHRGVVGKRHAAPGEGRGDLAFQVIHHLRAFGRRVVDPEQEFGRGDSLDGHHATAQRGRASLVSRGSNSTGRAGGALASVWLG